MSPLFFKVTQRQQLHLAFLDIPLHEGQRHIFVALLIQVNLLTYKIEGK